MCKAGTLCDRYSPVGTTRGRYTAREIARIKELWETTDLHVRDITATMRREFNQRFLRANIVMNLWLLEEENVIIILQHERQKRLAWDPDEEPEVS